MPLHRTMVKDITSLTELLGQDKGHVYRLALRITRSRADAEDVLQESLLKAYLKLAQFRGESRLATWLATIVAHESSTIVRRRLTRREVSLEGCADMENQRMNPFSAVDPGESPETCAIQAELREVLAEMIEELDAGLRVVFVMCVMGNFSIRETAETLELSIPAAKDRLLRARRRLCKQLLRRFGKTCPRTTS